MNLSVSKVTVATNDLVVFYVNTLIKIYNLFMYNMYEEVLTAGRHNPYYSHI
jgi:hypothetical protein